jgi:glycerol kinase
MVFAESGRVLGLGQREVKLAYPRPGWVEQDAVKLFSAQVQTAEEALRQAGMSAGDVAGIGITNQRETVIAWHRGTGEPVAPAIVWQDRRTAAECDRLRQAGHEARIQGKTGLVIDPYFSATKMAWILSNASQARELAKQGQLAFGTVESWLVWKLTGGPDGGRHVTDASNASRTMLLNIHTGSWDEELLELLDVPRQALPQVVGCSEEIGIVKCGSALDGVRIQGMAGDQQAALFGQLCLEPGATKCTYGTGCFVLQALGATPRPSSHRLLTTVARRIGPRLEYALEGSVFIGGAVVQWLRDGLRVIGSSSEVESLARSVEDNGGVYFVPAFVGLGAPYWDPYARGMIIGLTRDTTAGHIARAALESIAHQVADLVEALKQDSGAPVRELRVDGGAAVDDTLMQLQADVLQAPVVRPRVTEVTALGAAYLAGLAAGVWTMEDLRQQWQVERVFEPRMDAREVHSMRERWREAVARARGWAK